MAQLGKRQLETITSWLQNKYNVSTPPSDQHARDQAREVLGSGLTRRERFALAAMQGILAGHDLQAFEDREFIVWESVRCADALIEQLYGSDE